jgi:hypothetical protein
VIRRSSRRRVGLHRAGPIGQGRRRGDPHIVGYYGSYVEDGGLSGPIRKFFDAPYRSCKTEEDKDFAGNLIAHTRESINEIELRTTKSVRLAQGAGGEERESNTGPGSSLPKTRAKLSTARTSARMHLANLFRWHPSKGKGQSPIGSRPITVMCAD